MIRGTDTSRRGAALLLVLATLVLVTSACAILAASASTHRLHARLCEDALLSDDLERAAETAALEWLEQDAAKAVLGPDAEVSAIEILHDVWRLDGRISSVRITAWDQRGLAPASIARSGSPLRLAIPIDVLNVIDSTALDRSNGVSGLDEWVGGAGSDPKRRVFPKLPVTSQPRLFGDLFDWDDSWTNVEEMPPAIGAVVSPHNRDPVSINVNTAPRELLEAALRAAGLGGIEQILAARQAGTRAVIGAGAQDPGQDASRVRLVDVSDLWGFRFDVTITRESSPYAAGFTSTAGVRRSWWLIYKRIGNRWECLQRLVIYE